MGFSAGRKRAARRGARVLGLVWLCGVGITGAPDGASSSFDRAVRPVIGETCLSCHNATLVSGGLDLAPLLDPSSIAMRRETWTRVLAKLRAGEMPPAGVPGPAAENVEALIAYVSGEIERLDRAAPVDPGRVTARRLNRQEYANTIRDLLGVDIRPDEELPPDDSGYGFDTIGDVLTVSPTLMQKYLSIAERVAARAVGGNALPKPGLFSRRDRVRRLDASTLELEQIVEHDAEYIVRVTVVGSRPQQQDPVTLRISVDDATVETVAVPVQNTALNRQVGAAQRRVTDVRVFLRSNRHVFRAGFIGDTGLAQIPENARRNADRNIYPESIEIAGPFPPDAHAAEAAAARRPSPQQKVLVCDPASGRSCRERILARLARFAYRRPVSKSEVRQLVRVCDTALGAGYSPAQSLQFAMAAMLVSPHFVYRIEREPPAGGAAPITDLELASRLSYFLWSSMPDEALLRAAERRTLHEPAVLHAQVRRMIADPKSRAFAENFGGQWLETRSLDAAKPDAATFAVWSPELRDAMRTETQLFVDAVLRDDRPVSDFIDGRYTFLNERLAKHYGIAGVTGPDFRRVELTTDQRSGVFTHASVLTVSSYATRTSPVLRGKFLLENALNAPPPPPPPGVPPLDAAPAGVVRTMRQQMEQHRADPVCASCHARMDPLGFSLENYDAIGRWRTSDGALPIDASGSLPNGRHFSGPAELKAVLRENMPAFTRGLAEKMLTYALGRGVEAFDRVAVTRIADACARDGYRLQALIAGIIDSAPFRERRGLPRQSVAAAGKGGAR